MSLIGTNISGWRRHDTATPFYDYVKIMEVRQDNPPAPDTGSIVFNADGTIAELPHGGMIYGDWNEKCPRGEYRIWYDGEPYQGEFRQEGPWQTTFAARFSHDDRRANLKIVLRAGQNPSLFSVNHVDVEEPYGFRDDYVEQLKWANVLRFMDPMRTNFPWAGPTPLHLENCEAHWATVTQGRKILTHHCSIRAILELCQSTGAVPWICMHHQWSLEYTRQIMQHISEFGMSAYVEGGNENWNTRFAIHHGDYFGWLNGGKDGRLLALEHFLPYYEIAHEFGHQCVLPTQDAGIAPDGSPQLGKTKAMVEWLGDRINLFRVLAGKCYFGNGLQFSGDDDHDFELLSNDAQEALVKLSFMNDYAKDIGLEHGMYEGGPHVTGDDALRMNRHERMKPLMHGFVDMASQYTDVMCLYTDTGMTDDKKQFGLREHSLQETSPKLEGVLAAIGGEVDPPPIEPPPETPTEEDEKLWHEYAISSNKTITSDIIHEADALLSAFKERFRK